MRPTSSAPTSPGPAVTAMPSSSSASIPASARARSTTGPMVRRWARLASSGTTPPKTWWMSWERMTRLRSAGWPLPRVRTAAEVSSQLVSMPRIVLVATEEVGHEALVGRRAPGVLPDDFFHDEAVPVQQEAFGIPRGLVDPLDVAALVVQNVEGDAELPDEVLHVPGILVDADR